MAHWLDKVVELLQANTTDLRELARLAGADPSTFYRGIDPSTLDLEGQDIEGISFSDADDTAELLQTLKRTGRQEERLVLLLEWLVENPNLRRAGVYSFPVSTKYETQVINRMKANAALMGGGQDAVFMQALLRAINDLYQLQFTERKGLLLLILATYLGGVEVADAFVREKLRTSTSWHVHEYKDRILSVLESRF